MPYFRPFVYADSHWRHVGTILLWSTLINVGLHCAVIPSHFKMASSMKEHFVCHTKANLEAPPTAVLLLPPIWCTFHSSQGFICRPVIFPPALVRCVCCQENVCRVVDASRLQCHISYSCCWQLLATQCFQTENTTPLVSNCCWRRRTYQFHKKRLVLSAILVKL